MTVSEPISVAFVCVHNACRSQIAEAFARELLPDSIVAFSAGTHPASSIDRDAARLLNDRFGIDVRALHPKLISEISSVDVVVSMGCGVQCPVIPGAHRCNWDVEDPTGKDDDGFLAVMEQIRGLVLELGECVRAGAFDRRILAASLKALADSNRLRILDALADGKEHCACEILKSLDISQPTLSHHMAALRGAGVVEARKDGRWMHYRLNEGVLRAIGTCIAGIPSC